MRRPVQTVACFWAPQSGFCGTVVILALKKAPSPPAAATKKTIFEEGTHNKLVFAFFRCVVQLPGLGVRRSSSPTTTFRSASQCSSTRRVFDCKNARVYESKSLRVCESKTLRIEVSKTIKARRVFDLDSRRVSGASGQRNGVGRPAKTGSC